MGIGESRAALEAFPVLCVDLDGTLVSTDTLDEQLLLLLKKTPLAWASVLLAGLKGIAAFKRALARAVNCRPEALPYRKGLLAYLTGQAAEGRRILLVTAADQTLADQVARCTGLFETVLASDGRTNLKGEAKVAAIRQYLEGEPFEYAGNTWADVPVWKEAAGAILVNSPKGCKRVLSSYGVPVRHEFHGEGAGFWAVLRCLRLHQWSKNILVFAPIFLSHALFQQAKLWTAAEAFLVLSLAASFVYVLNDLLDLEADRNHPRKRHRPLASGALTIRQGLLLGTLLLVSTAVLSFFLPFIARLWIAIYVLTSSVYSALLKQMLFLDVLALAWLYTLRVLYGGAATHTVISPWTLAFCIFLFISLAICKRLTELRQLGAATDDAVPGRAYSRHDLSMVSSLGAASGYVSVLVLSLYVNSPEVTVLYRHPEFLWCLCPVLLYWISRLLIIANRGNMHDDPILFALRDRASYAVAGASVAAIMAAL